MRFTYTAFYILVPTRVWSPDGSYVWKLYIEPQLVYCGSSHIMYAIPTLLITAVLIVFPTFLLFFYPFRWFQRLLNRLNFRCLALNTFMDAFQGCYKDGTNGTQDCRSFAALQLLLQLIFPLAFSFTKEPYLSMFISSIVLGAYITAFVLMRPYKNTVYNKTDIPLLMVLLLLSVDLNSSTLLYVFDYRYKIWISSSVMLTCLPMPFIYLLICVFFHIKSVFPCHVGKWCLRRHLPESEQLLSATQN